jgi:hypothetical protein
MCLEAWFEPRWCLDFTESPSRQRFRTQEFIEFYSTYRLTPSQVLRGIRDVAREYLGPMWQRIQSQAEHCVQEWQLKQDAKKPQEPPVPSHVLLSSSIAGLLVSDADAGAVGFAGAFEYPFTPLFLMTVLIQLVVVMLWYRG